jgi:type VI secretion system protein ImpF
MPPTSQPQRGLLPSILDRLLDPESAGTAIMTGYTVERMAQVVRRDLEELLNTMHPYHSFPQEYPETLNSIVTFGLPDLASVEAVSENQRAGIALLIKRAVERFEPRLRRVKVMMLKAEPDRVQGSVRFRVEARLAVDPAPEVAFETILDMGTGKYEVKPTT